MSSSDTEPTASDIKRVGRSGQISLGKARAGQYFREEIRDDGAIVLTPVVVVAESHWTVRDQDKIRSALAWAAETPSKSSDLDKLVTRAKRKPARKPGSKSNVR